LTCAKLRQHTTNYLCRADGNIVQISIDGKLGPTPAERERYQEDLETYMKQTKLSSTFIVLDAEQAIAEIPNTPSVYQDIDARFPSFQSCVLVAEYAFSEDWPTWEMHPAGDEMLYLLAGEAEIHVRSAGVTRQVRFNTPGSYLVVPKGAWHTAKVNAPCRILFITPGDGTQHLPAPPD
jgi:mannose-6-phosphate isomerase-like protein (cupin superfamily)